MILGGVSLYKPGNLKTLNENEYSQADLDNKIPMHFILEKISRKMELTTSHQDKIYILKSETGSGKSTSLIADIYRNFFSKGSYRNIAVTQPRVLTARGKAIELGDDNKYFPDLKLGDNIGYQTGVFKAPPVRGIIYATLGSIVRKLMTISSDKIMETYSFIIMDEAHERSQTDSDLMFYLVKKFTKKYYKDPRCQLFIFLSATIDLTAYCDYFNIDCNMNNAGYVTGTSYPIIEHWPKTDFINYVDASVATVLEIHNENLQDAQEESDILVFMPGEAEIRLVKKALETKIQDGTILILELTSKQINSNSPDVDNATIYTLEQVKEKKKMPKLIRRIIVSTNVAETGITIPTLKYIIDTGINKTTEYTPIYQCKMLVNRDCTKSAIQQRRGRVGRKFIGHYYPLYSKATFDKLKEYDLPATYMNDLSKFMIDIYKVRSIKSSEFKLNPPKLLTNLPNDSVKVALQKLTLHQFLNNEISSMIGRIGKVNNIETMKLILSGYAYGMSIWVLATIGVLSEYPISDYTVSFKVKNNKMKPYVFTNLLIELFYLYDFRYRAGDVIMFIGDQFLEPYFIYLYYMKLLKINKDFSVIKNKMLKVGIYLDKFIEKLEIRIDLLQMMYISGFHNIKIEKENIFKTPRAFTNFITKAKLCIYEGYKTNRLYPIDGIYKTREGLTVNLAFKDSSPKFIIYNSILIREARDKIIYIAEPDKISIMDGYL